MKVIDTILPPPTTYYEFMERGWAAINSQIRSVSPRRKRITVL